MYLFSAKKVPLSQLLIHSMNSRIMYAVHNKNEIGWKGRLLAQLHGTLTPRRSAGTRSLPATPHRLKTAARSDCDYRCVSLFLSVHHRPQAATLAVRPCVDRSLLSEVMAHSPHGSVQTECILRLILPGVISRAFFVGWSVPAWKGDFMRADRRNQFRSNSRIA